ncbi:unnamed protein product [Linum tenue]|uniref:ABC transporter domain-containing protein n=1 Tax=Linum tenue TaxID=586396 RepID=A0AAV0PSB8_9ROSI|nr:unnamed protein product [Linum tenue]
MDTGDLYSARNSLRRGGSTSMWRSNPSELFSASSREENDEEALKWAALEKLPTYDRLRKGILASASKKELSEIDIQNLGTEDRKILLDRLVKVADQDNENFLRKLKGRMDRVGVELPTIEVRYEHLNVEAEATVGSKALPTFANFTIGIFTTILDGLHLLPNRKKHLTILSDVSGVVKPGRLTLLLGPPSSGKTTLLLALAGRLDHSLKVSGRVTYNGHDMHEFIPQKTSAYISQHDLHMGELTVRETLAFAARVQGVGFLHDMLAELSRREKAANIKPDPDLDAAATEGLESNVITDYTLKILGLEVCADILVGDEMIRGISGGQRKREMLVGPARTLFMDEISTGLDSSTTFQIVNSLKQQNHILNGTAVISLLQPAPETYNLFDDIILVSDGQIAYQGPRENVLEFFEHMGFKCPDRKGVADFLQEVTSKKDQKQYWTRRDQPYRFVTTKEFAEAFQSFHIGRKIADELSVPYDKTKNHPAALSTKKYGVGNKELLKANFAREYLLMKRNSFVYIFKLSQLVIMGLFFMTVFLRTEMHRNTIQDGGVYVGALFFSLVMLMFNGMAELPMTIAKLPVFYKQKNLFFYPPWIYSIPPWILKIPVTLYEVGVWVLMTYYVIGFDPNFGRLIRLYVLLVAINQMASALFRSIAATGRNMIVANTFGSFVVLLLFALSGFVLSREDIKKWWIWAYWASPMMYGQNAIVINEFHGKSWSHIPPNSTESLGIQVLRSRGFFTEPHWYWLGVGATFGFLFLFNIVFVLALTFLDSKPEDEAIASAGAVEMSTSGSTIAGTADDEASDSKKKGMVLPFEPYSLTFDDVIYSVDMPQEMKSQGVTEDKLVLLKGVSGAFRPGVLTALMGVSGAGKTTLMDVLAGRKTGGYIEGNITISGFPKKQETFARISGYCEQNDIHSPQVTVYESLVYSAWLRLPKEVDQKTRMLFVEEVMDLVELNPIRNSLVGLPGVTGLTTEQRKRLTIAVELVANPSIIFMDEPTSGLDARAAAIVMRTVRNTVDTGRTVVCTIHQPSIDIFEAFDELFLLKRGGQEIYVGPLGRHSAHLVKYFEEIEGVSKITDGYNPATWMLEVTTTAQEMALGVDFTDIYRNSDLYKRNKALIKDLSKPSPGSKDLHFPTQYSQPFLTQCAACLWKQHWSYWRNPPYTAVRFMFTTIISLTFGTVFWDLGGRTTKNQDLFNAMGAMFSAVTFLGVQNASSVQPVVAIERTVFYRERAAGMYSALPYAYAQVMIEIPYILVQSVVYGVITYSMMGFEWEAKKFLWYIFFMFFSLLYFTYYGMMTVAITPNHHIASIISSFFYSIWNLFAGFIVPRPSIPVWWRWNYWANPIAWTLYGLIVSQYGDVKTPMEGGQTVEDFLSSYFGFEHDFLGVVAGVMVGLVAVFAFIFAISIKSFNFQRR